MTTAYTRTPEAEKEWQELKAQLLEVRAWIIQTYLNGEEPSV